MSCLLPVRRDRLSISLFADNGPLKAQYFDRLNLGSVLATDVVKALRDTNRRYCCSILSMLLGT